MLDMAASHPTYGEETGWRRINAMLPEAIRIDPATPPTEEWLNVGRFTVHLDCMRRPEAPATLVLVHGAGGNRRRQRVGKEIRPGALAKQLNDIPAAGRKASGRASERLA